MRIAPALSALAVGLLLGACGPGQPPAPPPPAVPDTTAPTAQPSPAVPAPAGATGATPADPPAANDADDAGTPRLFVCDSGHRVELVGDATARVTLADGRVVDIERAQGPVEYSGIALSFDLADDGTAVLGQDEVGGFQCLPGS